LRIDHHPPGDVTAKEEGVTELGAGAVLDEDPFEFPLPAVANEAPGKETILRIYLHRELIVAGSIHDDFVRGIDGDGLADR